MEAILGLRMCGCEYQVEGDTHAHSVFLSVEDCSEVCGGVEKSSGGSNFIPVILFEVT